MVRIAPRISTLPRAPAPARIARPQPSLAARRPISTSQTLKASSPSSSAAAATEVVSSKAKNAATEAQSQLSGYTEKLKELAGPLGKRVQGLLGGYAEPILYNAKFVGAVLKQVYIAESLAPPTSLSTILSTYRTLYARLTDRTYLPSLLKSGEWKKVSVYALEAYGIFTIGEMIGRRSLVGYKLEKHGNGHH